MIRGFLLLSIGASLFASSDYVPFSKFSKEKQVEYNFIKIEKNSNEKIPEVKKIKKTQIRNYKKANEANLIKKSQIRKQISQNTVNIKNSEAIKEYKKENILNTNIKNTQDTFNKNFSITPRLTYSYMQVNGYHSGKVDLKDEDNVVIPEISIEYKNNIVKVEGFSTKTFYDNVVIGGEDLYTKASLYKLSYLYKYQNAKFGLAYNRYKIKWNYLYSGFYFYGDDKQNFPSAELHLNNSDENLKVEYGLSYGRNSDVKYAYEYYITLGYKIFKNDDLVIQAGYKNRTIDNDGSKFEFAGPTLTLSSTF
ncbi:hypothetical protein LPB137_08715 [Poseidonibacter parvus]|uniref:Uncharacterized protein n=1 Tax=Poseidonibacter parvus TaxID=1850254 RepID=A0A1P8KN33_9BACT|nr:hypothetical protein [Poseidonibacter parvus]APW65933.1 hypothetical protein LPB137_08715 [Poseidonibacter parvus]